MRTIRTGVLGVLAATLQAAAGCTGANVVREHLVRPKGYGETETTEVSSAARLDGDTLQVVARGRGYYHRRRYRGHVSFGFGYGYGHHAYPFGAYRYHPWGGHYYGGHPWRDDYYYWPYTDPYVADATPYEILLVMDIEGFPPRGGERDVDPGRARLTFGKLGPTGLFSRVRMTVTEAECSWDDGRPVIEFAAEAEHRTRAEVEEAPDEEAEASDDEPVVTRQLVGNQVEGMLKASLDASDARRIRARIRKLGVADLMGVAPQAAGTARPADDVGPDD